MSFESWEPALLADGSPSREQKSKQQSMRQNLRQVWMEAAHMPVWNIVFHAAVAGLADLPDLPDKPDADDAGHSPRQRDSDRNPSTPPLVKSVIIDLDTPPEQQTKGATKKIQQVGECRPALGFGRPAPVPALLIAPGMKAPSDGEESEGEELRSDLLPAKVTSGGQSKSTSHHTRSCKKRGPKSEDETKLEYVRQYMVSIKATSYLWTHVRSALAKKFQKKGMGVCPVGGYVRLMRVLASGCLDDLKCDACKEFLARFEFNLEACLGKAEVAAKAQEPKEEVKTELCEADPFAYAKAQYPIIELLKPDTEGKDYGYRCRVCCSGKQPKGKVGDLKFATVKAVKYFLDSHLQGNTHKHNVATFGDQLRAQISQAEVKNAKEDKVDVQSSTKQEEEEKVDDQSSTQRDKVAAQSSTQQVIECEALDTSDPRMRLYHTHSAEVSLWVKHASRGLRPGEPKHDYDLKRDKTGSFYTIIRHKACVPKEAVTEPLGRPMCLKCMSFFKRPWIIQKAMAFALKYWLAKVLRSRLFCSAQVQEQLLARVRATQFYRRRQTTVDVYLDPEQTSNAALRHKLLE